jgi:hypothetical protein
LEQVQGWPSGRHSAVGSLYVTWLLAPCCPLPQYEWLCPVREKRSGELQLMCSVALNLAFRIMIKSVSSVNRQ